MTEKVQKQKLFAWPSANVQLLEYDKKQKHWKIKAGVDINDVTNKCAAYFSEYGAYRFIVKYVHEFSDSQEKNGVRNAGGELGQGVFDTIAASVIDNVSSFSKSVKDLAASGTGGAGEASDVAGQLVGLAAFQVGSEAMLLANTTLVAAKTAGALIGGESQAKDKSDAELSDTIYNSQDTRQAEIWLPMHEYKLQRNSGVAPTSGAGQKSAAMAMTKAAVQKANSSMGAFTDVVQNRSGVAVNDNMGHRVTHVEFEKISLSWTLYPRNQNEMYNIQNIVKYFSFASLPVFQKSGGGLGKQLYYRLPPYITMEALTTDHTQLDSNGQPMVRVIKPKFNYYLTSFNMDAGDSNKGMMLSPAGFPMPIKITIELSKMDYTLPSDLEPDMAGDVFNDENASFASTPPGKSSVGTAQGADNGITQHGIDGKKYCPFG